MCEHLSECFRIQHSENRYREEKVTIHVIDKEDSLVEELEKTQSSVVLVQALSPADPGLLQCMKWAQNTKGSTSIPIIAICDGIDDPTAAGFIKAGAKEIIDTKHSNLRSTYRTLITAITRASLDTDRQNREREVLAIRLAEEQASNEKTYFVSMVSHEIRSPLQNIIGFSSLLEETDLDDEQSEYASYLNKNAIHLSELVSDVLDHSKIDRGSIALKYETISPVEAVEDAISFVETHALNKRINIGKQLDSFIPAFVEGDKLRIIQILKNLLENAIKFTPEGGCISVNACWVDSQETDNAGTFECEVEDSGSGIAPERVDRIFAPFVQVDPSRDQQAGGSGLGLALCKRLCEMMKGKIQIKHTSPKGTCIHFAIPFEKVEVTDHPSVVSESSKRTPLNHEPPPDGANILVVEDDKHSRAYIERFIRYSGLSCDIAFNGQQGINMFCPGQHLLIVTDVFMPHVNGIDLCYKIREIERERQAAHPCTIFAISAGGSEDTRNQMLEAGADHYLRKPIRIDQLRQMIRDALPQKTAPR
ncbi:MAG: ATP-binding protein [Verrucomicrobiota bacterium]